MIRPYTTIAASDTPEIGKIIYHIDLSSTLGGNSLAVPGPQPAWAVKGLVHIQQVCNNYLFSKRGQLAQTQLFKTKKWKEKLRKTLYNKTEALRAYQQHNRVTDE